MMFQLSKAGEAIQTFFQGTADRLARVSGFVERESKVTGAHWVQTLTFGFIETPEATLNQLAQVSTDLGVPVTAQGLQDRMTDEAVEFLQAMFGESLKLFRQEQSLPVEVLERFSAIEVLDSSAIGLPAVMVKEFPGCGGDGPEASVAALLVGSSPLWMILIDALRPGGKRPSWPSVAGVLVGFAGIVLLVGPGELSGGADKIDPVGAAVLIFAALLWSIGSLYSRNAALPSSPLLGTGMEMLAGGVVLLVLGALTGEFSRLNLAGISAPSLWGLAYLVVFGAWVGFGAYTWLLRVAPISFVSTYAYVNPVVAIVMGYLVAAEPITSRTLIAAAIIVGSVALTKVANQNGKRNGLAATDMLCQYSAPADDPPIGARYRS